MALNLYGKTNYEVKSPYSVAYAREAAIEKNYHKPNTETQWRYTRHATKTYSFKGMTEAAAKACLDAKQQQYMRRFMPWRRHTTTYNDYYHNPDEYHDSAYPYYEQMPYQEQVAQFNVIRNGDAPVFDVQITVNETIAFYSTYDWDPSTLSGCEHIENTLLSTSYTPTGMRLQGDTNGGPRYNSYLRQYDYDENLSGDVEVSAT